MTIDVNHFPYAVYAAFFYKLMIASIAIGLLGTVLKAVSSK